MWKNYLKIAYRNLIKNKTFSFINIFGLAVSMSVCLLILSIIKDAGSFDTFHQNTERIYRINTLALRTDGDIEEYATCPYPVGKALAEEYGQIETFTPFIARLVGEAKNKQGERLRLQGQFTNDDFFDIFNFPLQEGTQKAVLTTPYSMVITPAVAERFFGQANPIGATLEVEDLGEFTITGLFDRPEGKTHLEFEALLSASTVPLLENKGLLNAITDSWTNYYSNYNYIKIKEGADLAIIHAALNEISDTRYANLDLETRDKGYQFQLEPLSRVLTEIHSNNLGQVIPEMVLWVLSVLGLIVMLSACFNYTNLTLARALTRAREIGVRKVMGAKKRQVFTQFITEAVLTNVLALFIGYQFMKLLIPGFNQLSLAEEFDIAFTEDAQLIVWFLIFCLGVGLVAGFLPAFILAKTKPIQALQKLNNLKLLSKMGLRKGLLVLQFSLSLIFMMLVSVIYQQFNYAMNLDYGFERDGILNIPLLGSDYERMKTEMEQIPSVKQISAVSHLMGTWQDGKVEVRKEKGEAPKMVRHYFVDEDYLSNLNISLSAGQNFPENIKGEEKFIIVNERFTAAMDFDKPVDALGTTVILQDSIAASITGIMEDFNYKPVQYAIDPLILRHQPTRFSYLNVKVDESNMPTALAALERVWKKQEPNRDFRYESYHAQIKETYSFTQDLVSVTGFFAFLTIVIAALGLLGMATYTVEVRAKEIGIRKIIGANFSDLVLTLSKGFFMILILSIFMALPIGYFLNMNLLDQFVYTIEHNIWLYLSPILLLLLIGIITIGSQTIVAALRNPVEALKGE